MPSLRQVQGDLVGEIFTCDFIKTSECLESLDLGRIRPAKWAGILNGGRLAHLKRIGTVAVRGDATFGRDLDNLQGVLAAGGCRSLECVGFCFSDRTTSSIGEDTVASLNAIDRVRRSGVTTRTARFDMGPVSRVHTFNLELLRDCSAPSLSSRFVKDKIQHLARLAEAVVWSPPTDHLIAPTDISETAKELAAKLRFSNAVSLRICAVGDAVDAPVPAASSALWSPLTHLPDDAFPETLDELRPMDRVAHEAARQLLAAGKIKGVSSIVRSFAQEHVPASDVGALLHVIGGEKSMEKVDVKVSGEGGRLPWGDSPEAVPRIEQMSVFLTVPDVATAALFVHASLASCLKIRGLKQLGLRVFGHADAADRAHFADRMAALFPTRTMSCFRIAWDITTWERSVQVTAQRGTAGG